ncbi:hypothetical protein BH09CHL1_BH09CHL1_23170 [soil metagenome]
MVTSSPAAAVEFTGTAAQKKTAAAVFAVFRGHGQFMSFNSAIQLPIEGLADQSGHTANEVKSAVEANSKVFSLETNDEGVVIVSTTRGGRAPVASRVGSIHDFRTRFMTPLPKPAAPPPPPAVEAPRIDRGWDGPLYTIYPDAGIDELDILDDELPEAISIELEDLEIAPEVAAAPEAPRTITVAPSATTDVTGVDDLDLASALGDRLAGDIRVANFGDQWMLEERVPRVSRGDLRRMKDYIQEQERPLTDDMLVQDVFGIRPGSADFELMRFAVNFRLSKEHRDFDFVGTSGQRFWSTSSLPQIGTKRRKPNEIGTDLKYLVDETPEGVAPRTATSLDHVLTFYEYHLGLLPYDETMQALLPAPLLPNQRSAVLTFECPQSYTTYLVELRFPTPNRGGFILGLDDFFTENLVPGALISIQRTDNDGHYKVEYLPAGGQSVRLLELEDRRQRYVFRPTTYACEVDERFLLSEDRFPRLGAEKPLDEKARRRAESVVAATFERVGVLHEGHGYAATFDDLLAAVNVERPFSPTYLKQVLEQDESGAFAVDPDGENVYTYVPGNPV